ncbi:MAG: Uma2 family endonuclease [Aggregatilineales bacterium]
MRRLAAFVEDHGRGGHYCVGCLPETKEIEVFAPGQPVHILNREGTLEGDTLLPGFSLAVSAIFPD